jgi:hypothetical protein
MPFCPATSICYIIHNLNLWLERTKIHSVSWNCFNYNYLFIFRPFLLWNYIYETLQTFCYTMQFVSQLVSQFCCDTNCTRNCKLYHASQSTSLAIFLLQQPLHEVESGSTFCNDCGNAATHFKSIAQCNIPLATSLAMFIHWMSSYWLLTDNMAPNVSTRGFYTIFNNNHCKLHGTYCLV